MVKTRLRPAFRILALGVVLLVSGCGAPSDQSIISHFKAHRAEFSRLVEMFDHDGISGRISCDAEDRQDDSSGRQPISDTRRAEYLKLFSALRCDTAAYYHPGLKRAEVTMWVVGMLFAGQSKSLVFTSHEPPEPIVQTTDNYQWTQSDHQRGSVTLYRHIDGPWYLEYSAN